MTYFKYTKTKKKKKRKVLLLILTNNRDRALGTEAEGSLALIITTQHGFVPEHNS